MSLTPVGWQADVVMERLQSWGRQRAARCTECGCPLIGEFFFTCHFCGERACYEHVNFHRGVHSEFEPIIPEGR